MQTIASQLDRAFRTAIAAAFGSEADPVITVAQNEKFGDYQSNAAMGLAKQVSERTGQKTNPRAVAEQIRTKLDLGDMASEVSIAGPGFINVRLSPDWLARQLEAVAADERLGVARAERPQRVVVDYSGPNIAKEMHVGHLRSTIIGDAISRVIELQGHEVIRQNHIGDWGTQFGMLIAHLKEPPPPKKPEDPPAPAVKPGEFKIDDLEAFYREAKGRFDKEPGFADRAREAVVRLQGGDADARTWWQFIVDETRKHYQPIYQRLSVKLRPEHERGESSYNDLLPAVVADLKAAGLAVESEGATVVFIDGADKPPLIVEKTGGGYLYATTDLAGVRYRVGTLRADRIIYTHDSRQAQHFDQVFRTARKICWAGGAALEYAPFGTMLGEDGKPIKTRSGENVKLKTLLDEAEERALRVVSEKSPELSADRRRAIAQSVGIGGVKYADLSKDRTSDYLFSWDRMLALDGNTAPYLQYAHARVKSIFRKAAERGILQVDTPVRLESPFELALAKHVLRLGEAVDLVARELKPHYLALYLYDLATKFSGFFENCPVIQSEEPVRSSRLRLSDLTARTLATGLDLLGIEHPDQM